MPDEAAGLRLDQCLARCLPELSRRTARLALDIGCVFVDRKRVKVASRLMRPGQVVVAHLGGAFKRALADQKSGVPSERREGPAPGILFEDEHLLVVHKPAGLLTAPTPERDRNTLLGALSQQRVRRLFLVHRLDRQTSGVLVVAKTKLANRELSERFKRHDSRRQYDAFVEGVYPVERETLEAPVRRRSATFHVEVAARYVAATHLSVTLETGRTHQIRIHMQQRGTFVLGDRRYGRKTTFDPPRMALHARCLAFRHPVGGRELRFEVPLPNELSDWAAQLERVAHG